jgi:hypothetical protein
LQYIEVYSQLIAQLETTSTSAHHIEVRRPDGIRDKREFTPFRPGSAIVLTPFDIGLCIGAGNEEEPEILEIAVTEGIGSIFGTGTVGIIGGKS